MISLNTLFFSLWQTEFQGFVVLRNGRSRRLPSLELPQCYNLFRLRLEKRKASPSLQLNNASRWRAGCIYLDASLFLFQAVESSSSRSHHLQMAFFVVVLCVFVWMISLRATCLMNTPTLCRYESVITARPIALNLKHFRSNASRRRLARPEHFAPHPAAVHF